MSKKNRERGEQRREAAAARREAIAKQFNLPASAMAVSKPNQLGRSMFLSKADANRYFSAMKGKGVDRNDPTTWNPKRETK
jgi:hypothetical protein